MIAQDMLAAQYWSAVNGWPTSGFMNAVRNSEDAVVFLDTSNTADWNSGLKITFLKYQDN